MHGGTAKAGPFSATWKHGQHSEFAKSLPQKLAPKFARILEHEKQILEQTRHIALVEAQLENLLEQWRDGGTPAAWKDVAGIAGELQEAADAFTTARKSLDAVKAGLAWSALSTAIADLGALAMAGVRDASAWQSIAPVLELQARLKESESRRLRDERESLTSVQALALFAHLAEFIAATVTSPSEKRAIGEQMQRLMGGTIDVTPAARSDTRKVPVPA